MIYTNETVESDLKREAFIQAIKDDVKEEGSINCLSTVMHTIRNLVAEDASFNVYNGKPLNDAHLVRMFELYDACKQNKPEYTSFYDDSGKEILKLQPQFKTESGRKIKKESHSIQEERLGPRINHGPKF